MDEYIPSSIVEKGWYCADVEVGGGCEASRSAGINLLRLSTSASALLTRQQSPCEFLLDRFGCLEELAYSPGIGMPTKIAPIQPDDDFFDDDGWQDMPIIRESVFASGLDEEDQKKYHYVPSSKAAQAELRAGGTSNATGTLLDTDDWGNEWRSKVDHNESEYTRLRGIEEDEADEVHLRTKYLFDEDKAMTPLNQMQATKNMLTEAQRIAYVGVCQLTCREMAQALRQVKRKELKPALQDLEMWSLKIMGRLYYHMELATLGG